LRAKILFIINSLTGGGAERVMATLLSQSGPWRDHYEISLALLDDEPAAYAVPDWVKIHQLDCRGNFLKSLWQLSKLEKTLSPDVTLSFLTRANIANGACRRRRGKAFIISERVNTIAHLGTSISGLISRLLVQLYYPRASHIIAVSQGVAKDLSHVFGISRDKISVISNPVDTSTIALQSLKKIPKYTEGPYVAAMGRLVENKNFGLLIDAFAASSIRGELVIIGDGPLKPMLENRIAAYGLQERVILTGFLHNPFPLLAGARIFVLPSNAEGFPNGLVEAMSTGTAVISTNCESGPAEILAQSAALEMHDMTLADFGILVPCNNVPAMAQALQYLQDEAIRKNYAKLALTRAKAFTPEKAAARYWQVIENNLGTIQSQ
jgi:glycosyltransferase involved in cell wall biosynthesis